MRSNGLGERAMGASMAGSVLGLSAMAPPTRTELEASVRDALVHGVGAVGLEKTAVSSEQVVLAALMVSISETGPEWVLQGDRVAAWYALAAGDRAAASARMLLCRGLARAISEAGVPLSQDALSSLAARLPLIRRDDWISFEPVAQAAAIAALSERMPSTTGPLAAA